MNQKRGTAMDQTGKAFKERLKRHHDELRCHDDIGWGLDYGKTVWVDGNDGSYIDLFSGEEIDLPEVSIPAYGFYYLKNFAGEQDGGVN